MLTAIQVKEFKSYREAILPLAELTVLIGSNASGKSNLVEALQLLAWIARGRRFSEIVYALKERQLDLRGPIARLVRSEKSPVFFLGGALQFEALHGIVFDLAVGVQEDGMHLIDEWARETTNVAEDDLSYSEECRLYEANIDRQQGPERHGDMLDVAYAGFDGAPAIITCIDQQAVFTQLTTPARIPNKYVREQEAIPKAARQIQSALESILFLDPVPRRMRDYSFAVERTLQGDGSNLSAVLFELCKKQGRKADVLAFIRALPEQDILDVSFLTGPRGEVMVQLTESFGGDAHTYEAALLSDGTLRVLSVAAALLSVAEGSLVVIEEIDNGVHPTRAKLLLDNIQRVARQRSLRVLLTTHNPALLDAIPLDAIPDVVACYRDPQEGDSRLMPLRDIPDYPELMAQGPVGQIVTRGILERYLKSPRTAEDKAEQARKLLEMLQVPGTP
jgi:energy-coupling factor transporter ATP-binding protein EcfA2